MFTIGFNSPEKKILLDILAKDGSREAKEFIDRINNAIGFFSFGEECSVFNYHTFTKEIRSSFPNPDGPNFPSGLKIEYVTI